METLAFVVLIALACTAVGVLIGRYYVPDDRAVKRAAGHGKSYLQAVHHLVGRDTDAAIDELLAVVEDDIDDLEPYFALAALFRTRGEWERAIRVHQAIELRAGDDRRARLRSLYELGLDFRAAGMPRRATRAMEECIREHDEHAGALRALTGLYEEQGRYGESAQCWERLERIDGRSSPRRVHMLAAAAERAAAAGALDEARAHVRDALRLAPDEAHARVASAQVHRRAGEHAAALEELERALSLSPDLIAYLLPVVVACCEPLGEGAEERAIELLGRSASRAEHPEALERAMAELEADDGLARARLDALAEAHPQDLTARVRAARLALAGDDPGAVRHELERLVGAEGPLAFSLDPGWQCQSCGTQADRFTWRCSACRHWGQLGLESVHGGPAGGSRERRQFARDADGAPAADDALPPTASAAAPRPAREHEREDSDGQGGSWLSEAISSLRRRS